MKRQNEDAPWWVMLRAHERRTCEWALRNTNGHVASAAAILGINKAYLYKKIRDLDIDVKEFKQASKPDETERVDADNTATA